MSIEVINKETVEHAKQAAVHLGEVIADKERELWDRIKALPVTGFTNIFAPLDEIIELGEIAKQIKNLRHTSLILQDRE